MNESSIPLSILKALIGLVCVFMVHLPRLLYLALQASYAAVFRRAYCLTADPKEHLRRAMKILRRKRNSELLYAALELRFALERMVNREAIFADKMSEKKRKEYDPYKKWKSLERIDHNFALAHSIYWVNTKTGEVLHWGEYDPLDPNRISFIKGRLGDLLHPKEGITLGIPNCAWYRETTDFLEQSCEYLESKLKKNESYFTYAYLDQFEMVQKSNN